MEIKARERAAVNENIPPNECLPIFDVLSKAERLLSLCGECARRMVGAETKRVIENECCKAVTRLTDRHLYRLNNNESNYRLMRSGTHRPPR